METRVIRYNIVPVNGATEVVAPKSIVFTFSEFIKTTGVDVQILEYPNPGETLSQRDMLITLAGKTITIVPKDGTSFIAGHTIKATVTGVKDYSGLSFVGKCETGFETAK